MTKEEKPVYPLKPFTEWAKYEFAIRTPDDEWHHFIPSKSNRDVYDEAMKLINEYEDGVDLYVNPDKQDDNYVVSFCDKDGWVYSPSFPNAIRYLCDLPLIAFSQCEAVHKLIEEGCIRDVYSYEDFKREYDKRLISNYCTGYEDVAEKICEIEGIQMPDIPSECKDYVSYFADFVDNRSDYYYDSDEDTLWYIG